RDPASALCRDEAAVETRLHKYFEDGARCDLQIESRRHMLAELHRVRAEAEYRQGAEHPLGLCEARSVPDAPERDFRDEVIEVRQRLAAHCAVKPELLAYLGTAAAQFVSSSRHRTDLPIDRSDVRQKLTF